MRYRMIGIDMDGTLLDSAGEIHPRNQKAIAQAQAQGVLVVPCTGRGWAEATLSLDGIDNLSLGVFNTGALIAKVDTGESVDLAMIEPHLVHELVEALKDEPEAVLVYRERYLAGHDYLVTGNGKLTNETQFWFDLTGARVHHQRQPTIDDLHHTLRVGMVASDERIAQVETRVKEQFYNRVFCHRFGGVPQVTGPGSIWVLEIFAQGVDKWRGLSWIAQKYDIDVAEIAVIGDEINDLAMIHGAGCGIAMGNAVQAVKDIAQRETLTNTQGGVGYAIDQMLAGKW